MMHATQLRVFALWTGAATWESSIDRRSHLAGAELLRACDSAKIDWSNPVVFAHFRGSPTCPTCVVLCDEAAGLHHGYICARCREPFEPHEANYDFARPTEWVSKCFTCKFWEEKLHAKYSAHTVIVGHKYYSIGTPVHEEPPRRDRSDHLGFGGARWIIEFSDGRKQVTHNLWSGGDIPELFWSELPDNARFLKAWGAP